MKENDSLADTTPPAASEASPDSYQGLSRIKRWNSRQGRHVVVLHADRFIDDPIVGGVTGLLLLVLSASLLFVYLERDNDQLRIDDPNTLNLNVGLFSQADRFRGRDDSILGGLIGIGRFNESFFHKLQLLRTFAELPYANASKHDGTQGDDQISQVEGEEILQRRGIMAIVFAVLLFPICQRGIDLIESGYQLLGRVVIGCSFLFFCTSLILACLTTFSWSWGWWL